jgi:hypothetical protein
MLFNIFSGFVCLRTQKKEVPLHCVFHSIRFKVNKGWSTAVLLFLFFQQPALKSDQRIIKDSLFIYKHSTQNAPIGIRLVGLIIVNTQKVLTSQITSKGI